MKKRVMFLWLFVIYILFFINSVLALPDLVVENIELVQRDLEGRQVYEFKTTIKNIGDSDSQRSTLSVNIFPFQPYGIRDVDGTIYECTGGSAIVIPENEFFLAPGESLSVSDYFEPVEDREITITAIADVNNLVQEVNKENNRLDKTFQVDALIESQQCPLACPCPPNVLICEPKDTHCFPECTDSDGIIETKIIKEDTSENIAGLDIGLDSIEKIDNLFRVSLTIITPGADIPIILSSDNPSINFGLLGKVYIIKLREVTDIFGWVEIRVNSGRNYNEIGTANGQTDSCLVQGGTFMSISEYYCEKKGDGGEVISEGHQCEYGCSFEDGSYVGKCAGEGRILECIDNDGGSKYFQKGTVSADGFSRDDFCGSEASDGTLFERTCANNRFNFEVRSCSLGCKDGACVLSNSCNKDEDCSQIVRWCSSEGEACSESTGFKCENPGTPESQCVESLGGGGSCVPCEFGCTNGFCLRQFIRGDTNNDNKVDLSDAIYLLNFLFKGGQSVSCLDTADANDDSKVDISDAINILRFLFQGGERIVAPYPEAGVDPTEDSLVC